MKAVAALMTLAVAVAVLAGVTAVLWWFGVARVPVLVLVYGCIAVAGCGFALGRCGRLLAWQRQPPDKSRELAWQSGASHIQTGLVWEQDDPAIVGPTGSPGETPFGPEVCQ